MPFSTSHSARSVAATAGPSAAAAHLVEVERHRLEQSSERREHQADLVEGVEEGLLVLLQIAVVRERKALERGEDAGQMPDQPPRLCAHQLGHVGVLLLGEHRAPRRVSVVENREAELLGRPHDELLTEPGQVNPEQRQVEQRLCDEVPVGDRIEGVLEPCAEAEVGGHRVGVERQRRSCESSGAERRHVEPGERVEEPVEIPGERPSVSKQVVREKNRLGPLHVGVPGQVGVFSGLSSCEEDSLQADDLVGHPVQLATRIETQIRRNLVVAAPPGVELGTDVPRHLGDPTLQRRVDVLVAGLEDEFVPTRAPRSHGREPLQGWRPRSPK